MSAPKAVTPVKAIKVRPGRHLELPEHVATEEPMQVLVAGPGQAATPLSVTMRTPGHDFELAAGFVVTEGVAAPAGIRSVDYCEATRDVYGATRFNHVAVRLAHTWDPGDHARNFAVSASCGMCGKTSIEQLETACARVLPAPPFPAPTLARLPEMLRKVQKAFDRTGGLHAAGLFDRDGTLHCAREDVGRHNAVDKVAGWTVLHGPCPAREAMALAVSGRVSFEIVQKAAVTGIGIIAAVSAPSSLAIEAADRLGVSLAGFVRDGCFNVYTHPERVALEA